MESVKWQKHQHDLIIAHAQALYGAEYLWGFSWDVITSKTDEGYTSHAIVYERRGSLKKWKALMSGGKEKDVDKALTGLLEELRRGLGKMF